MLRTATFALTLLSACIAQAQTSAPPILVKPGQGVEIARTVFVDGDGQAHDTAVGALIVDPRRLAAATGIDHGYLQVVTNLGPVIYDAPIDANPDAFVPPVLQRLRVPSDGRAPNVHVPFRLASAARISSIKVKVLFSPAPLFDARTFSAVMDPVPTQRWKVKPIVEAVGGDGPDKVQMPELPPIGDPVLPPPSPDFDHGDLPDWQYTLPNTSNVETAWNQCAPAAFANVLSYLEHSFGHLGINFPHFNTKGVGVDGDESSFVSRMDWYMDRPHTDTCIGGGTNRCGESSTMRGILAFLRAFDGAKRVTLSHQGGSEVYPDDCGEDPSDRESVREGQSVTFEWLCERVQEGAGIVLTFGYYSPIAVPNGYDEDGFVQYAIDWDRTGGHVVRVYGCGEVGGQRFIRTLDDGQQDRMFDADDEDDIEPVCEERLGLRTQLWFLHENDTTNGRLELGDASRQIDFAMALTPAP